MRTPGLNREVSHVHCHITENAENAEDRGRETTSAPGTWSLLLWSNSLSSGICPHLDRTDSAKRVVISARQEQVGRKHVGVHFFLATRAVETSADRSFLLASAGPRPDVTDFTTDLTTLLTSLRLLHDLRRHILSAITLSRATSSGGSRTHSKTAKMDKEKLAKLQAQVRIGAWARRGLATRSLTLISH
jgi:hypothetical protein